MNQKRNIFLTEAPSSGKTNVINSNNIILDEIGKVERFSASFKEATINVLDALNVVIGTITFGGGGFIQKIKEMGDIENSLFKISQYIL